MTPLSRQRPWPWLHLAVLLVTLRAVAAPEPSKRVLLEAVGAPDDVKALQASLEDWLRAMQLELAPVAALPPIDAPSFARVRAVWTEASCIVEVFSRDGVLRRRKELPRGGPPLLVSESAALIAQAGVQELSVEARQREPLPTPVGETAAPLVEAPAPPPPPFGFRLAGFFQARGYGDDAWVVFGGGAEASATFGDAAWRPGLTLLVGYQGPVSQERTSFRVQLQAVELRLLPAVRHAFGALEVELGLGGGMDLLLANTSTSQVPSRFVQEHRVDPAPFFTAMVGARWKLTPSAALFLRAVVDLDPAKRRYVSTIEGAREVFLEPWTARPALQLGFSFDLLSRPEVSP